ncbi:hypothetical protein L3X38_036648 [Prunus dulcis]|uniref:Retrovirus-related Pol polyprotein from transposon TNT 1-94-like beta-barrel domain-containing protein n=1 Tax=Prunus dulcis TaxID=3755 RepID=A0AAD4YPM3_PRUDU|nr:hypothetical protein L3X38_036648 [Prunus dulcis]
MGDNSIVSAVAAASANLCVPDSILGTGSNTWIIDTGAFDHMTYDAKFFDELSSNTRDPYITSANSLPSPITGEGTISLTHTLSLSRALLVPDIHCNLLSVGQLLDTLNVSATFYPTHYSFQDLKTHETIVHGHAVLSTAYLINRTPSRILDFKTSHDVFGDYVSPVSVSKLPPKVFGVESELESFGLENLGLELENDVFEDTALGKETTCRTKASDKSPIYEDETCGEETTSHPLELDCDSCMDEFNAIPPSALPVPQSIRDSESSEEITNDLSVSTYQLPPRTTLGKPKVQYSPDIHAKSKYLISHYMSIHRLFKSYASYLADILTKDVSTTVFLNSLDKLGMRDTFAST